MVIVWCFYVSDDSWVCVGSIEWNGLQQTLAVWGNDAANSERWINGYYHYNFKAESNGVIYDVSYSPKVIFEVNGIEIINDSFEFYSIL